MSRYSLYGFHLSIPCYKVALYLSMTGQSFTFKPISLRAGEHKTPEFLALNRFGQVPALTDHETGISSCQAPAIMEYLAGVSRKLRGGTPENKQRVREWLYWSFDKLNAPIFRLRAQRFGFRSFPQSIAEMYFTEGALALATLNNHLAGRKFMVGTTLTIADIEIYGAVSCLEQAGHSFGTYPNLAAFIKNFEKQKGFKTALAFMPV